MANFLSFVVCVAAVAYVVDGAVAATPSTVVMDQCVCTCPVKPAPSPVETKSRARRETVYPWNRNKRWGLSFGPEFSYSTVDKQNNSLRSVKGDNTQNSNNGGNSDILLAAGAISGDDNKLQMNSHGTVGTDVGNLNTRGFARIG